MLSNAEKSISFAALRDVLKFSYVVINASKSVSQSETTPLVSNEK